MKKRTRKESYTDKPYWYFTTHGVMPGSVPKNIEIIEIRDGRNRKGTMGTFVALDRVLTTDELKRYDLIELEPETEAYKKSSKKRIKERAHNPVRVNKCRVKVTDIEYDIAKEDFDRELTDKEFEKERRELIKTLPQSLTLTFTCDDDEDIEDTIADKISDETGWLVDTFKYDVISTNESMRRKPKRKMTEAYYGEPMVFMNTWANYNEHGADGVITPTGWMSIDDAIEYFEKYAEYEPFINDTEDIPESFGIGERSTVEDLEVVKDWVDMDESDKELVAAICEIGYSIDEAIDKVQGSEYFHIAADTDEELAYEYIEELGGIEQLGRDTLETYFDYERFGRDLSFDFHKTEYGYIRID